MSKNAVFGLLGQGNVIPIHREIVRLVGGYECAALLEQIVYWMPKAEDPEMFVYKTRGEWMRELLLTEHQFKSARANLITLKLLEEKIVRVPKGQSHINIPSYRLDMTHLQELLEDQIQKLLGNQSEVVKITDSTLGFSPTRGGENHQPEVVKITDSTLGFSPTRGGENHRLEVEVFFLEAEVVIFTTSSTTEQNIHTKPTYKTKEGSAFDADASNPSLAIFEEEIFEEKNSEEYFDEFFFLSEKEENPSSLGKTLPAQVEFSASAAPDVDNLVDNAIEPEKSVPKKEKPAKAPKPPKEKPAGNQTRGLLAAALGGYGALNTLTAELAKVDRKGWLEIPLERVAELKKQAVEQTEAGRAPKWTLVKLLDAEINPERGIATTRASASQGRPQNALEAAQRLSEGQNAALEHYRRTRGVQA